MQLGSFVQGEGEEEEEVEEVEGEDTVPKNLPFHFLQQYDSLLWFLLCEHKMDIHFQGKTIDIVEELFLKFLSMLFEFLDQGELLSTRTLMFDNNFLLIFYVLVHIFVVAVVSFSSSLTLVW